MLTPPSDRLYKFIAIGGLALVIACFTYSLQKYEEAEVARIEAATKFQRLYSSIELTFMNFAKVAPMHEELMAKMKSGEPASIPDEYVRIMREIDKLTGEMAANRVEAERALSLAQHYIVMRNVWIVFGVLGALLGSALSFIGFRQWLRHERPARS